MSNLFQIISGGIKCDNENCNYTNINVKVKDYEKWINKQCPKCGKNLLTQEDYESVKLLLNILDAKDVTNINDYNGNYILTLTTNGNGKVDVKVDKNN